MYESLGFLLPTATKTLYEAIFSSLTHSLIYSQFHHIVAAATAALRPSSSSSLGISFYYIRSLRASFVFII